jgi:allophanate hydrolase subunit 2
MRTPNPDQAHASLSTTGTASTLATLGYTIHEKTATLLVQAVGGDVRMTLNGTNPTASLGIKIADGTSIELGAIEAGVAKFITGSGTPKLEIAAYIL